MPSIVQTAIAKCFDLVIPPRCLACKAMVDCQGSLCSSCWQQIDYITAPQCKICGFPFEYHYADKSLCGACLQEQPIFNQARSTFIYTDASKPLILRFKHADGIHAALTFGKWMANAGKELLDNADLLLPVPLHWTRLFTRRYNQAALLVNSLAQETGIPAYNDILTRNRYTPSQGQRTPRQRKLNVSGAFNVAKKHQQLIVDKRLLLVDDVYTTGATVNACAKSLLKHGVAAVDVLTLARIV